MEERVPAALVAYDGSMTHYSYPLGYFGDHSLLAYLNLILHSGTVFSLASECVRVPIRAL